MAPGRAVLPVRSPADSALPCPAPAFFHQFFNEKKEPNMSRKQFMTLIVLSMIAAFSGGVLSGKLLPVSTADAQKSFYHAIGIGTPPSNRGESLRVKGWTILGMAGSVGGQLTFMPPDGTGFYSIDNPGGQRLRFSGGGRPGKHEYMSISHPGIVRINGNLQVKGRIVDWSGKPFQAKKSLPPIARAKIPGGGKADSAGHSSLQVMRDELNAIWNQLEQIRLRVNQL
jgi:hypothetical protein